MKRAWVATVVSGARPGDAAGMREIEDAEDLERTSGTPAEERQIDRTTVRHAVGDLPPRVGRGIDVASDPRHVARDFEPERWPSP